MPSPATRQLASPWPGPKVFSHKFVNRPITARRVRIMATAFEQNVDRSERPVLTATPKRGRRRIVLPIALILAALGGMWAFKNWNYARGHASTDDAAVDGHLIPVLAKVSGYVQSVAVRDNDLVKGDSLLVQIDPSEYRVRLAQAEADLAAAQAAAGGAGSNGQAQAMVDQATG